MYKVLVEPIGVTVEVAGDDSLLAAVSSAAVALPVDCAGRGTCGKCLVRLGAGELSPPTSVELRKLTPERRAEGWRLACQARPVSERVSIEVRETAGRRQILTASKLTHGEACPAVRRRVVSLPRADVRGRPQRPRARERRARRRNGAAVGDPPAAGGLARAPLHGHDHHVRGPPHRGRARERRPHRLRGRCRHRHIQDHRLLDGPARRAA